MKVIVYQFSTLKVNPLILDELYCICLNKIEEMCTFKAEY